MVEGSNDTFHSCFDVVGQSSMFNRIKAYTLRLDLSKGELNIFRKKQNEENLNEQSIIQQEENHCRDSPSFESQQCIEDEVSRKLSHKNSFRGQSITDYKTYTFRFEDMHRITRKNKTSAVRLIMRNVIISKAKTFWFDSPPDRDMFISLIHAFKCSGNLALKKFASVNNSTSSFVFSEYLIEFNRKFSHQISTHQKASLKAVTEDSIGDEKHRIDTSPCKMMSADNTQELSCMDNVSLERCLLQGETMNLRQDHTWWLFAKEKIPGLLVLTQYRIMFFSECAHTSCIEITEVSLASIFRVDKSLNEALNIIVLYCKDLRRFSFEFDTSSSWMDEFMRTLHKLAFPESQDNCFALSHRLVISNQCQDGWRFYDALCEYERLGLNKCNGFRVCALNEQFELCKTYPSSLIVPHDINDDSIRVASKFRSRARFPVITWRHPISGAVLARCSQPLSGIKNRRCKADEQIIEAIRLANPTNNDMMYILDARPYKSAVGNTVMGKGYENIAYYHHCELKFLDIDNIHVIRNSLERLLDACDVESVRYDDVNFLSKLEASQWLYYIRLLLTASVRICDMMDVEQGTSVVTHCSDGWDRTPQLCAIAQIMMDPFYRTIKGFAVLVEKDWCSFGHKFAARCGHCNENFNDDQRAPIFIQFLDCVWQMLRQFPLAFEFNESFLTAIVTHLYSCRFGTFLYNTEKERIHHNIKSRSTSLWTYLCLDSVRDSLVNPLFYFAEPFDRLIPLVSSQTILLWSSIFQRQQRSITHQSSVHSSCSLMADKYRRMKELLDFHNIDFSEEEKNAEALMIKQSVDHKFTTVPYPSPAQPSQISSLGSSNPVHQQDMKVSSKQQQQQQQHNSTSGSSLLNFGSSLNGISATSFVSSWLWPTSSTTQSLPDDKTHTHQTCTD